MGPSRANPLTGEIFDADIIFDASMVRWWQQEYQLRGGSSEEPASLIQASRHGWGLALPFPARRGIRRTGWNDRPHGERQARPRMLAVRQGVCQCAAHMQVRTGHGGHGAGGAG